MFDRWFDSCRWAWCVLSGLLLAASFPPFSCAVCGWIALVPAWWAITRSENVRRRPMRHGYVVGLVFFGATFWWISNVTAIGTFFLILYLALYPAFWFLLVARLVVPREPADGKGAILHALGAASLWVALEWFRSWMLTGFSWNELGVSQAPSIVFRQLAAFGGVPLISFVLVTVNVLWAEGLLGIVRSVRDHRVVRPSFPFAVALALVAACFALGWHHLQRHRADGYLPPLRFACVQPNIPQIPYDGSSSETEFQKTEQAALDKTEKLSFIAIRHKPDLLIWPEAMVSEGVFNDRPLNEAARDICQAFGGYFLLGSQDFDLGGLPPAGSQSRPVPKLYNAAYLFTPHGDQFEEYRKTQLVIVGEFLPFGDAFPILRKIVGVGMDFSRGPGPKRFAMKGPPLTFAPLICFEDTLPDVATKAARLRPDFFVTITNDGWYRGWFAAWGVRQHLNNAVFRCVEHDLPMVRCANTGISCVIDQNGTVTDRLTDPLGREIDVEGIFARTLMVHPRRDTLYDGWGDWIVLISLALSAILGVRLFGRSSAR